MPPHIRHNLSDSALEKWRIVWNHFIDSGLPLFPTHESLPKGYLGDYITLSPMTKIRSHVDSMNDVFDSIVSLWKDIDYHIEDSQPELVWNYLGLSDERTEYLEYLIQYFWQNQASYEGLSNYLEIVEQPWKILNHPDLVEYDQAIQLPTDFFSDKSIQFVEMVGNNVPTAKYNPYMIHTDKGSFQWTLLLEDFFIIQGALINEEKGLFHTISVLALTEIVI